MQDSKEILGGYRYILVRTFGSMNSALIRYINIFSDTSANIKYAVQKRIVLELAVIKLCKPEMETDYSALLDRVRVLEQKLENGAAGSVVSGNNNGEGSSASAGVTALAGEAVQGAGAVCHHRNCSIKNSVQD